MNIHVHTHMIDEVSMHVYSCAYVQCRVHTLYVHMYALAHHVHAHVCRSLCTKRAEHLIRSEAAKHVHLLEHSELVPLFWEGVCVGVYTVIILLPLLHHTSKCHTDTLEPRERGGEGGREGEEECTMAGKEHASSQRELHTCT